MEKLFEHEGELYVDKGMTTAVHILSIVNPNPPQADEPVIVRRVSLSPRHNNQPLPSSHPSFPHFLPPSGPSFPPAEEKPADDVTQMFSSAHIRHLLSIMRHKLPLIEQGLANTRLRRKARQEKVKLIWKDIAQSLSEAFHLDFDADEVTRKWYSLRDEFIEVNDEQKRTGRVSVRFPYFQEMDELVGHHHDVNFPVVATPAGVFVRQPTKRQMNRQEVDESGRKRAQNEDSDSSVSVRSPQRKKRREIIDEEQIDEELLEYFKGDDAKYDDSVEDILEEMKKSIDDLSKLAETWIETTDKKE